MLDQSQLNQQLHELDRLLEALEQLNLRNQTLLPNGISVRLQELGMVGVKSVDPLSVLIPRVLDEQQRVRRLLASIRRGRTTERA